MKGLWYFLALMLVMVLVSLWDSECRHAAAADVPTMTVTTQVEPVESLPANMTGVVANLGVAVPPTPLARVQQEVWVGVYLQRPTLAVQRVSYRVRYDPAAVEPIWTQTGTWTYGTPLPGSIDGTSYGRVDRIASAPDAVTREVASAAVFPSPQGDNLCVAKLRFRCLRAGLTNFLVTTLVPDGRPTWQYRVTVLWAGDVEVLP